MRKEVKGDREERDTNRIEQRDSGRVEGKGYSEERGQEREG